MKKKLLWAAAIVAGLIIVAGIAGSDTDADQPAATATTTAGAGTEPVAATTPAETTTTTAKRTEDDEVAITECGADEIGWGRIAGTATNGSSKRSDYSFEIVVEKDGVQIASAYGAAYNVEPGQTALWDTSTVSDWVDGASCRVVSVTRDASL